jgi:hypothetical protein
VDTAGGGKEYTLHVHTAGSGNEYTLHVHIRTSLRKYIINHEDNAQPEKKQVGNSFKIFHNKCTLYCNTIFDNPFTHTSKRSILIVFITPTTSLYTGILQPIY